MADKKKTVLIKVTSKGLKESVKELRELNKEVGKKDRKVKVSVDAPHLKKSLKSALASLNTGGSRSLKIRASIDKTFFKNSIIRQIRQIEKRGMRLGARVTEQGKASSSGMSMGSTAAIAGTQFQTTKAITSHEKKFSKQFDGMSKIFKAQEKIAAKSNAQMNLLNKNMERLIQAIGRTMDRGSKARNVTMDEAIRARRSRREIHLGEGRILGGVKVSKSETLAYKKRLEELIQSKEFDLLSSRNKARSEILSSRPKQKDSYGRNRSVGGLVNRAGKGFSLLAGGNETGSFVGAYADIAAKVFALGAAFRALKSAADMSVLTESMEKYGETTNINLGRIARGLQKVVDYSVDFKQAAQTTTLATAAGFNSEQIERMGQAAKNAALALGRDMGDALDRLTRGVVKAEPEVLDELGIILRLEPATKKYADSIGKTTKELTTFEKSQAVLNEVLSQADKKFGAVGDKVEVNPFSKLQAQVTELALNLGQLLTGPLSVIIETITAVPEILLTAFTGLMAFLTKNTIGPALSKLLSPVRDETAEYTKREKAFKSLIRRQEEFTDKATAKRKGQESYTNLRTGVTSDLRDRAYEGHLVKAENRSISRRLELLKEEKLERLKLFNIRRRAGKEHTAEILKNAKAEFLQNRKKGVGIFKSFSGANKRMVKDIGLEFKDVFGDENGVISKSLAFFQKRVATTALAIHAFAGIIKSAIMGVITAFLILPIVEDMLEGIAKGFGLVKVSTDNYSDATKDLVENINSQEVSFNNIVNAISNMDNSLDSHIKVAELTANAYSGLSDVLDKNVKGLQEWITLKTSTGEFADDLKDILTLGFSETQFDAARKSIESLVSTGKKYGMSLKDLGINSFALNDATGFWSGSEEKIFKLLKKGNESIKGRVRQLKSYETALKAIKEASADISKAWRDISLNLPTTPIDDLTKGLKKLEKGVDDASSSFRKKIDSFDLGEVAKSISETLVYDDWQGKLIKPGAKSSAVHALIDTLGLDPDTANEIISERWDDIIDLLAAKFPGRKFIMDRLKNSGNFMPGTDPEIIKWFYHYLGLTDTIEPALERLEIKDYMKGWEDFAKLLAKKSGKPDLLDKLQSIDNWRDAKKALKELNLEAFKLQSEFILAAENAKLFVDQAKIASEGISSTALSISIKLSNKSYREQITNLEGLINLANARLKKEKDEEERHRTSLSIAIKEKQIAQLQANIKGEYLKKLETINKELQNSLEYSNALVKAEQDIFNARKAAGQVSELDYNTGTRYYAIQTALSSLIFNTSKEKIRLEQQIEKFENSNIANKRELIDAEKIASDIRLKGYQAAYIAALKVAELNQRQADMEAKSSNIDTLLSRQNNRREVAQELFNLGTYNTEAQKEAFNIESQRSSLLDERLALTNKQQLAIDLGNTKLVEQLGHEIKLVDAKDRLLKLQKDYNKEYLDYVAKATERASRAETELEIAKRQYELQKSRDNLEEISSKGSLAFKKNYLKIEQQLADLYDEMNKSTDNKNKQEELNSEIKALLLEQELLSIENHERILELLEEQHEFNKKNAKLGTADWTSTLAREWEYTIGEMKENTQSFIDFMVDASVESFRTVNQKAMANWKEHGTIWADDLWDTMWISLADSLEKYGEDLMVLGQSQITAGLSSTGGPTAEQEARMRAELDIIQAEKDSTNIKSSREHLGSIDKNIKALLDTFKPKENGGMEASFQEVTQKTANSLLNLQGIIDQVYRAFNDMMGLHKNSNPFAPSPRVAAAGGFISGPGGPKEDKIPAWLSNGEYVINAKAYKNNKELVEMINAQGLANGGQPGWSDLWDTIFNSSTYAEGITNRAYNLGVKQPPGDSNYIDSIRANAKNRGFNSYNAASNNRANLIEHMRLSAVLTSMFGEGFATFVGNYKEVLDYYNPTKRKYGTSDQTANKLGRKVGKSGLDWATMQQMIKGYALSGNHPSLDYTNAGIGWGFAKGGLASKGRNGDTELAHVNKGEQALLRALGGAASRNPRTGLLEYFNQDTFDKLGVLGNRDTAFDEEMHKAILQEETKVLEQKVELEKESVSLWDSVSTSMGEFISKTATVGSNFVQAEENILADLKTLAEYRNTKLDDIDSRLHGSPNVGDSADKTVKELEKQSVYLNKQTGSFEKWGPKVGNTASVDMTQEEFLERYENASVEQYNMYVRADEQTRQSYRIINSDMGKTLTDWGINAEGVFNAGAGAIAQTLSMVFRNGTDNLGDTLRAGAANLAMSISQSMMEGAASELGSGIMSWVMDLFAEGGIAEGGFRSFASGGKVTKPTLGLVGEGKYNEAVVPLPDGKSIPVIGNTGGDNTNNITINVNVDKNGNARTETEQSGGMDGEAAQQLGYMVSQAVQAELVEQQRPGGLLSRYQ